MIRKSLFVFAAALLAAGFFLALPQAGPALAQEGISSGENTCFDCHEERYTLYDRGKWYCLNETSASCTDCHAGRAGAVTQERAHEGLIANPLVNEAAACQSCHPDNAQERARRFAAIAGTRGAPAAYDPATVQQILEQPGGQPTGGETLLDPASPSKAELAGFGLLGFAYLVLFAFARRCWKADRACRSQEQA